MRVASDGWHIARHLLVSARVLCARLRLRHYMYRPDDAYRAARYDTVTTAKSGGDTTGDQVALLAAGSHDMEFKEGLLVLDRESGEPRRGGGGGGNAVCARACVGGVTRCRPVNAHALVCIHGAGARVWSACVSLSWAMNSWVSRTCLNTCRGVGVVVQVS